MFKLLIKKCYSEICLHGTQITSLGSLWLLHAGVLWVAPCAERSTMVFSGWLVVWWKIWARVMHTDLCLHWQEHIHTSQMTLNTYAPPHSVSKRFDLFLVPFYIVASTNCKYTWTAETLLIQQEVKGVFHPWKGCFKPQVRAAVPNFPNISSSMGLSELHITVMNLCERKTRCQSYLLDF